jgi:hypothetical protein
MLGSTLKAPALVIAVILLYGKHMLRAVKGLTPQKQEGPYDGCRGDSGGRTGLASLCSYPLSVNGRGNTQRPTYGNVSNAAHVVFRALEAVLVFVTLFLNL